MEQNRPKLETTPTLAVIPDVRCSRLLLRMWKCHRHLRHPRADILGFAAHWGAWSSTPHAPTPAPLKDAVPAGIREQAAHRGSERPPRPPRCQAGGAAEPRCRGRGGRTSPRVPPAPPQGGGIWRLRPAALRLDGAVGEWRGERTTAEAHPGVPPLRLPPPPPFCAQPLRHIQ